MLFHIMSNLEEFMQCFPRLKTYLFVLIVAIIRMFYNEQRKPYQTVPK